MYAASDANQNDDGRHGKKAVNQVSHQSNQISVALMRYTGIPQVTDWSPIHFRSAQAIREITALMSNIVVIGKKNVNPGRLMTISPGRRNRGSRLIQDQVRPSPMITTPSAIRRRCMRGFYHATESKGSGRALLADSYREDP
jgi:hypothetical protein